MTSPVAWKLLGAHTAYSFCIVNDCNQCYPKKCFNDFMHVCNTSKPQKPVEINLIFFQQYWWLNQCWFSLAYLKDSINMDFKRPEEQVYSSLDSIQLRTMLYMVILSKKQHYAQRWGYNYKFPSLFTRWSTRCIQTKLKSPTGHAKCGNVNPGKPDLLARNVLQQHYNFSLLVLCLHLTIIDCRASGLSQIQLQKF